jgi:hypothetical protein
MLEIHTPGEGDALSKLLKTLCKLHGFDMGKYNMQGITDLEELVKFARNESVRNEEWENCISQLMRLARNTWGADSELYAQACCYLLRARTNIDERTKK